MSDYNQAWLKYRRLRSCVLGSYLAVVVLAIWFRLFDSIPDRLFGYVVFLAILLVFLSLGMGVRLARWSCPRCGKRYFMKSWYLSLVRPLWYEISFGRRCVHCGLPKYSNQHAMVEKMTSQPNLSCKS